MRKRLAPLLFALLAGCPPPDDMNSTTATVSGAVRVFQGSASARRTTIDPALQRAVLEHLTRGPQRPAAAATAAAAARLVAPAQLQELRPRLLVGGAPLGMHEPQVIRPGEVIVRFDAVLAADEAAERLRVDGLTFTHGGFASRYLHLAKYVGPKGEPISEERTRELVALLAKRPGVKFTEPNGMRHALVAPNDNLYPAMWHLPPINLPAAWDIEKGDTNPVVVAVVDTGVYAHPDLTDRLIAGYDLISDPSISNDGDGRDNDPTDPGGDQPQGRSSWHGTHTAGTIGATTNNGTGVAGVNWNAKVQPVRVLGKGGGTDFDIAAGITWASGGTVPNVPANPTPAKVISMSLGGQGGPLQSYQDSIDDAASRGVLIAVAAGNDNTDASKFTPCNQTGVLCIGATRFNGKRASYSNYGQRVDLMAPGGEVAEDANGDGYPDGVLSTVKDDATGMPAYQFENGTSMATPHISGVLSLMKSRQPSLTFAQAKQALISTANTDSQCSEGCGAGLVNVVAALQQLSGVGPTGPARLSLSTAELLFSPGATDAKLQITNTGGQTLDVNLTVSGSDPGRITLGSTQVQVNPGATREVALSASLSGLTDGAATSATLDVTSNGGNATVNLKLKVPSASAQRAAAIALVYQDSAGKWQVQATVEAMPTGYSYSLTAPPGSYYLFGVQDSNGNGSFEDNEPVGLYPSTDSPKALMLTAGQSLTGYDFTLAPLTNLSDNQDRVIGQPCTDNSTCSPGICGTGFPGGYCTQNCATQSCPLGARCVAGPSLSVCLASCAGVRMGQSDCRSGYVCENDGTGSGVCIPRCSSDAVCMPQTCNMNTGYCE